MFTGITKGTVPVVSVATEAYGLEYWVDLGPALSVGLELGASVSIDGVCQTVAGVDGDKARFQAIPETLRKTTLSELRVADHVSVERSLRAGDEIGGHEVAGHVTGTGEIVAVSVEQAEGAPLGSATELTAGSFQLGSDVSLRLRIAVPREWLNALLPRGFVAVDGSSLTIAALGKEQPWFEVCLIPETLRQTNLGKKGVGSRVNIELDARTLTIVATVERVLASLAGTVLPAGLAEVLEQGKR